MLHIERMRLQLPPGFEHRASNIALLLGESMATIQTRENRSLDRMSVGPITILPNATDKEIAHSVSQRITSMLRKGI